MGEGEPKPKETPGQPDVEQNLAALEQHTHYGRRPGRKRRPTKILTRAAKERNELIKKTVLSGKPWHPDTDKEIIKRAEAAAHGILFVNKRDAEEVGIIDEEGVLQKDRVWADPIDKDRLNFGAYQIDKLNNQAIRDTKEESEERKEAKKEGISFKNLREAVLDGDFVQEKDGELWVKKGYIYLDQSSGSNCAITKIEEEPKKRREPTKIERDHILSGKPWNPDTDDERIARAEAEAAGILFVNEKDAKLMGMIDEEGALQKGWVRAAPDSELNHGAYRKNELKNQSLRDSPEEKEERKEMNDRRKKEKEKAIEEGKSLNELKKIDEKFQFQNLREALIKGDIKQNKPGEWMAKKGYKWLDEDQFNYAVTEIEEQKEVVPEKNQPPPPKPPTAPPAREKTPETLDSEAKARERVWFDLKERMATHLLGKIKHTDYKDILNYFDRFKNYDEFRDWQIFLEKVKDITKRAMLYELAATNGRVEIDWFGKNIMGAGVSDDWKDGFTSAAEKVKKINNRFHEGSEKFRKAFEEKGFLYVGLEAYGATERIAMQFRRGDIDINIYFEKEEYVGLARKNTDNTKSEYFNITSDIADVISRVNDWINKNPAEGENANYEHAGVTCVKIYEQTGIKVFYWNGVTYDMKTMNANFPNILEGLRRFKKTEASKISPMPALHLANTTGHSLHPDPKIGWVLDFDYHEKDPQKISDLLEKHAKAIVALRENASDRIIADTQLNTLEAEYGIPIGTPGTHDWRKVRDAVQDIDAALRELRQEQPEAFAKAVKMGASLELSKIKGFGEMLDSAWNRKSPADSEGRIPDTMTIVIDWDDGKEPIKRGITNGLKELGYLK